MQIPLFITSDSCKVKFESADKEKFTAKKHGCYNNATNPPSEGVECDPIKAKEQAICYYKKVKAGLRMSEADFKAFTGKFDFDIQFKSSTNDLLQF